MSRLLTNLMGLLPTQTETFGETGLYLDGLLMDNLEYVKDKYMMFKLSTILLSEELSFVKVCQSYMPYYMCTAYEVEMVIS